MNKILFMVSLCLVVFMANAQSLTFKANTGDAELDITLNEMNTNAKLNLTAFKSDLKLSFSITDAKLDQLFVKMQPAEVYYALEIAKLATKDIDVVVKSYETNKSKGWGVIAKEMGIKPGSKEFHALKNKAKGKSDKTKGNKSNGKKVEKIKGAKGNGK